MSFLDWCIVLIPLALLLWAAVHARKYARSVADFLVAGRIAGRYVLCVGDMVTALSVIALISSAEQNYQTGISVGFWGAIVSPVLIFMSLTGYCFYRWRETRCLSIGQFLELRYGSKIFRVFCAGLRVIAEMSTNALGPAIATNFFIYYLGLPHRIMLFGISLPCYAIIVVLCLLLVVVFIWPAGRISLLITDCVQGIMSYPIFLIIGGYFILNFSWSNDVTPAMWNHVQGESFMNPYDISQLRDFNLFATVVTLCGHILNRASWLGGDTTGAAKTPHEQKMAGVLGNWRSGFAYSMIFLISIFTIVFMTSPKFINKNHTRTTSTQVRQELSVRVLEEAVKDPVKRRKLIAELKKIPEKAAQENAEYIKKYGNSPEKLAEFRYPMDHSKYEFAKKQFAAAKKDGKTPSQESLNAMRIFEKHVADMRDAIAAKTVGKPVRSEVRNILIQQPLSQKKNLDTPYLQTVRDALGDSPEGRLEFQNFRSLYNQMMMPSLVRRIFPVGVLGLFCLLMVMLLVSTVDSYLYNSAVGLVQDLILPMFKGHLSSQKHILFLRLTTIAVAIYFLISCLVFAQLDYIFMFTMIMVSLWLGGAGPIMVFGLYSRFGNLTGAWCSIILGSGHSVFGLVMQRNWALTIYPFLERMGWVEPLNRFLVTVSAPFHPWISWSMNPVKYPINSMEIYFISMVLGVGGYIIGSLLTYKPYDLDKLLHRGKYADGPEPVREKWTLRTIFKKLVGITPEYTRGDRFLAYLVFFYSIGYSMMLLFVGTIIWNIFAPWPDHWWSARYLITSIIVPIIVGCISTVWFLIGGIRDMRRLFIDLGKRVIDENDNGQVLKHPEENALMVAHTQQAESKTSK